MTALLTDREAAIATEHNYGRLYQAPPSLKAPYRELDPRTVFNAGVGNTSSHKDWN